MWYLLGIVICMGFIAIVVFELKSTNRPKIMYKYLRKNLCNENPYHVVTLNRKLITLYFNVDKDNVIRGVLYLSNEKMPYRENLIWEKSTDNISKKNEMLKIIGHEFTRIYVAIRGRKYTTLLLGNDDLVFQSYMEDPGWEGAILKR